jgi:methionyl-tRNA formyltransferase
VTRAVVFAYSEVGVRCVRELLAQGVEIPLLFTHADDPGENQWFGSVQQVAEAHDLRVETPINPNTPEWIAAGVAANPDFLFSFYYRYMLDKTWLAIPRRGALNMHGSLLPKYRGRAPVHWAILNGESVTGASLHYMVEKPAARPLDLSKGSYFGRRRPEDGRIDWRRAARAVHDLVRAVAPPFPGAFSEVNGCRLAVLETRVDAQPVRYSAQAPCLYAADGEWYADCVDGRRLRIVRLAVNGKPVTPDGAPPALAHQPLALT